MARQDDTRVSRPGFFSSFPGAGEAAGAAEGGAGAAGAGMRPTVARPVVVRDDDEVIKRGWARVAAEDAPASGALPGTVDPGFGAGPAAAAAAAVASEAPASGRHASRRHWFTAAAVAARCAREVRRRRGEPAALG